MMLCIQWDDAEFIKRKLVNSRVVALPPPMAAVPRRVAHRDPVCIFVGSGALPNVDGVQWFLEAVWPGVLARVPSAQLRVYGSVCSRVETSSESVKLLGRVDDIVSCYDEAKLAVVPLRIGSGLKIKIVEAITMGMPIVTTEVGAQGLFEIRPQPFALCKSADEMIARTAALLLSDEECGTLEAAARGAQALFDPQRISAVLDAAMREISVESPIIDNEAR
ncbi:MAG: glycosyltransferase family 4 protein [Beijerinckiaceae bacterium]|nr:glycosyltransferase family 4 protein [Beijerinckiaceae bacterium]